MNDSMMIKLLENTRDIKTIIFGIILIFESCVIMNAIIKKNKIEDILESVAGFTMFNGMLLIILSLGQIYLNTKYL